jgi:hypothetical protein
MGLLGEFHTNEGAKLNNRMAVMYALRVPGEEPANVKPMVVPSGG